MNTLALGRGCGAQAGILAGSVRTRVAVIAALACILLGFKQCGSAPGSLTPQLCLQTSMNETINPYIKPL